MRYFSNSERYLVPILMGLNLLLNLISQISPLFFLTEDYQDLFNGAITLPNFIRVIIYTTITAIYIRYFSANPEKKLNDCKNLILIFGGVLSLLSILGIYYAEEINKILLPGFSNGQRSLLHHSFIILMVLPFFYGINAIFRAYLYSGEKFKRVELIEILGSILTISVFILCDQFTPLNKAALGVLIGAVTQSFLMYFSVNIGSIKYSFDLGPIRWYLQNGKMLFASNLYYKTDPLIDKNLLSRAPAGDLSSQGYAMMLATGCSTFVGKVFSSTIIKPMADFHMTNDFKSLQKFFIKRGFLIFIVSIIFYILSSVALHYFIKFYFYFYGESENFIKVSEYYNYLFFVLIFGAIGSLSSNALYAINLSKIAAINGMIVYTAFVFIKIISFNYFGVYGLINSTNFYYFLTATINGYFFLKITSNMNKKFE